MAVVCVYIVAEYFQEARQAADSAGLRLGEWRYVRAWRDLIEVTETDEVWLVGKFYYHMNFSKIADRIRVLDKVLRVKIIHYPEGWK